MMSRFDALLLIFWSMPFFELLLLVAPYFVGRVGGYFYWLVRGRRSGDPIYWLRYHEMKPMGFWTDTALLWTVQFSWVSVLFILNFVVGGRIFARLF